MTALPVSLSDVMSSALPAPVYDNRPSARLAPRRIQPMRALRAFRRLVADKEDTRQVFEIMSAMAGKSVPRGYARLLKTPEGGRQAYLARELADRLQDRDWLASLPAGSVGAAYLDFIRERDLSAYGLADESRKVEEADIDAAHPTAWYARRQRDVHDIWHVLTGYRTDALGEACVVAFSLPQTGSPGFGLIAGGADAADGQGSQPVTILKPVGQFAGQIGLAPALGGFQEAGIAAWHGLAGHGAHDLEHLPGVLLVRHQTAEGAKGAHGLNAAWRQASERTVL